MSGLSSTLQAPCPCACDAWSTLQPRHLLPCARQQLPRCAGRRQAGAYVFRACRLPGPAFRFLPTDVQWQHYCKEQGARVEAAAAALEEQGQEREAYKLRLGWSGGAPAAGRVAGCSPAWAHAGARSWCSWKRCPPLHRLAHSGRVLPQSGRTWGPGRAAARAARIISEMR